MSRMVSPDGFRSHFCSTDAEAPFNAIHASGPASSLCGAEFIARRDDGVDRCARAARRRCVVILVDVSEGVFRLGYGVADALGTLQEGRKSLYVAIWGCAAELVIDDYGFIFALPPLLVEETKGTDDQPNAV